MCDYGTEKLLSEETAYSYEVENGVELCKIATCTASDLDKSHMHLHVTYMCLQTLHMQLILAYHHVTLCVLYTLPAGCTVPQGYSTTDNV